MDQSTKTSQLPPKHSTSIYDNAAADDIKALYHHPTPVVATSTTLSPNSKSRIIREAETFVQSLHHHPSTKGATENLPTAISMNDKSNTDTIATRLLKAELIAAESQAQLKEWSTVAEELREIIKRQQQDMPNQNRAPPPKSSSRPQVLPRIAQLQQLVADMRSDLLATNGTISCDTTTNNNNGAAHRPRFSSMITDSANASQPTTTSSNSSRSTKRALLDAELDLRKAAQEAEHLRGRLKAAESEIASKDDRLQATEKRAQAALDREAVLQTDVATLQKQLADAEARATNLIAKDAQNNVKMDQMKARMKQAEACIQEATAAGEAEVGRYKQRLAAAEESSKKKKARIAELQEEVDAADRKAYLEHAGVVATVRALEHEVAMAQRQENEAQQEAQRVKRELQALRAKINSNGGDSSSSMSIIDVNNTLKAELIEAKKEISDLRAQLEEEKTAVPCYQQELQGLKMLLQSVSLAASTKDTDLDDAKDKVRDLETKLALSYDLQYSKMVDREEAAAYTESQMMNLVVKYEKEQTEMIEAHDAEVRRMKREMDELKTEVTALHGAKNEAIAAGQKEMAELRAGNAVEVENLRLQVVELSSALAAARQKIEDDGIMMAAMERTTERMRRMEEEGERGNATAAIDHYYDDDHTRGRLIAAEAALEEAAAGHSNDLATLRTGFEMQLQAQELQYMAEFDHFNSHNMWRDVEVQALVMDMDNEHNKGIAVVFTAGVMRSALLRRELEEMVEMDLMAASTGIAAALKKKEHCHDGFEDIDGVRRKLYGDGTTTTTNQQLQLSSGGVLNIKTPGGTMRQITVDIALQAAMHAEQEIERLESLLSEARQESDRRGDLIVQVQDMVAELQEYEGQRVHQVKQLTVQLHDEQSRVAMYESRLMEYQELNATLESYLNQMEKERGMLIMELKQHYEEKEREEEEANTNQRQYEDKAVGRDIDDDEEEEEEEEERVEQEGVVGDMSKEKKKTKKAGGAIRRFGKMINNKLTGGSNNNSRQSSPNKKEKQRTKEIINNPMAPLQASIELKKEEERWADDLVKHWELSQGIKRVHWREENIAAGDTPLGEKSERGGGGRPVSAGQLSEVPDEEEGGRYYTTTEEFLRGGGSGSGEGLYVVDDADDNDKIMHSNSLYVMYDENSRYS